VKGGSLTVDGSSTVFPIVSLMGTDFGDANEANVTVNKSGTGSGMGKFIRGEIDIATASRPIKPSEIEDAKKANLDFIEIPLAYDGVCVVVSKENTLLTAVTPAELKMAWEAGSKVKTWADWKGGLPASKINFYGPSENHGTYEYFTEAINEKKDAIRSDYQANQEYNAIVSAVAGDKFGIAYVGFNYFAENTDKLTALSVDSGSGPVAPSEESIMAGTYAPLSRPLFMYVSKKAFDTKPAVKAFVEFALSDAGAALVKESRYVPLPKEALAAVLSHVTKGEVGSRFQDVKPGMTIQDVLAKEKTGA
jgi:phosphate transport system substrate-binding protein